MSLNFFKRLAAEAVESGKGIRPRAMSRFEPFAENPAGAKVELPEDPVEFRPSALAERHDSFPRPSILPSFSKSAGEMNNLANPRRSSKPDMTEGRPELPVDTVTGSMPQRPIANERVDETISQKGNVSSPVETISPNVAINPTTLEQNPMVQAPDPANHPQPTIRTLLELPLAQENATKKILPETDTDHSFGEMTSTEQPDQSIGLPFPNASVISPSPVAIRPRPLSDSRQQRVSEDSQDANNVQPPTIEISIGRIVLQPEAPQPSSTQPFQRFEPQVTLEAYLRQRNGGTG